MENAGANIGDVSPEVREFFDTTIKDCTEGLETWGIKYVEIGEIDLNNAELYGHRHPKREHEFIAISDNSESKLTFSHSFVKECFEASKDGKNELVLHIMMTFPTC